MNDITQFLVGYGGPVLFVIVFAEQAGLPLPAAPWLLAAGALSASGKLNPALAIGMTALAAVMADSLWFYVGRRGGQRVLRLFCRLSLSCNSCVGRTKSLFARHGLQALVAAKFLPGLGAVMPPLAGALGMSTSRFLLLDGLGSLFYGTFYVMAGFLFRDQLRLVVGLLDRLGFSALLLALVVVVGYIAFKYTRRSKLISRGIKRNKVASRKSEGAVEDASGISMGGYLSPVNLPAETLNALEFQNLAHVDPSSPLPSAAQAAPPLYPHAL
jgi:membrane protein DedA with SNARE-associated domain